MSAGSTSAANFRGRSWEPWITKFADQELSLKAEWSVTRHSRLIVPLGVFGTGMGKPEGPWNKFHCSGLYGMIGNAVVFLCRSPFYLRHLSGLLLNSRCVPIAAGVCGFIALSRPTPAGTSSVYSVAPSARNRKLSWSNTNRSPCCDPVCRYRRTIWTPQLF